MCIRDRSCYFTGWVPTFFLPRSLQLSCSNFVLNVLLLFFPTFLSPHERSSLVSRISSLLYYVHIYRSNPIVSCIIQLLSLTSFLICLFLFFATLFTSTTFCDVSFILPAAFPAVLLSALSSLHHLVAPERAWIQQMCNFISSVVFLRNKQYVLFVA